jgi:uncharacterized repeat protein (TIGR04052 family)
MSTQSGARAWIALSLFITVACSDDDTTRAAAGTGEETAHDAGTEPDRDVRVHFKAQVFDRDFACGRTYDDMGSTHVEVEPADLRFYVQDLRLIDDDGVEVPVQLKTRDPWQTERVSLLDFEDGTGACGQGNELMNSEIDGTVPAGDYSGVVFSNGVPEELNHEDPLDHPAPLQFQELTWGWLTGFRFFVAEVHAAVGGVGALHVGSSSCSGDPKRGAAACAHANRNEIRLDDFDPDRNSIVVDVGAIFQDTDLTRDAQCHSSGMDCEPMFESVGLDFESGERLEAHPAFRVE